jgi:transposase
MTQRKRPPALSLTHPDAAGIDIGSANHFVAVPADRDDQPVRQFPSFTADLHRLADWLTECGVTHVAMESTGVYWIPLYELLESKGFTVYLVNARHVKNVSGRKSDVLDCQWLQQLMSYGLLAGAFRPQEQICRLRAYTRQRGMLIDYQSRHVQHIQKALAQMNVQLANVISDVMGTTGQAIVRAIIGGQHDPEALARLRHTRIRASHEELVQCLQGNWRDEHLFALKQAMQLYDFFEQQRLQCDHQIQQVLDSLRQFDNAELPRVHQRTRHHSFAFDARAHLFGLCGVDLTRINGIDATTALKFISEVGPDLSRFKSAKHFASWLGLCPGTKISGGKVLSSASKRSANRAAQALRIAAVALRTSKSALGAYYRKLCARMDKPQAVTATAHKFARLIYAMLTGQSEFVERSQQEFEEQYRHRTLIQLQRRAHSLGFVLTSQTELPTP